MLFDLPKELLFLIFDKVKQHKLVCVVINLGSREFTKCFDDYILYIRKKYTIQELLLNGKYLAINTEREFINGCQIIKFLSNDVSNKLGHKFNERYDSIDLLFVYKMFKQSIQDNHEAIYDVFLISCYECKLCCNFAHIACQSSNDELIFELFQDYSDSGLNIETEDINIFTLTPLFGIKFEDCLKISIINDNAQLFNFCLSTILETLHNEYILHDLVEVICDIMMDIESKFTLDTYDKYNFKNKIYKKFKSNFKRTESPSDCILVGDHNGCIYHTAGAHGCMNIAQLETLWEHDPSLYKIEAKLFKNFSNNCELCKYDEKN